MSVTIKELSRLCGISISTVSKALNGYKDISDATRETVLQTAKEIGYYPNAHARALKTKRSFNLGVLFADDKQSGLTHSFFSAVLESFKKEAEHHGYDITFICHNMGDTKMTFLEHCHHREVDGVCIASINFQEPEIIQLVNSKLPIVTIDHVINNRTCIRSDNQAGIQIMMDFIYGCGHRRIGNIHGQNNAITSIRLGTFYRVAQTMQLEIPDEYIGSCEYNDPQSAYHAAMKILSLKNPPTCVFVSDDFAALGVYEAASDLGLEIPRDISIAGYDGIPIMQLIKPRITTIRQDTERIGSEAARKLIVMIENPKTAIPEIVMIPCSLIKGETIATLTPHAD